MHTCLIRPRALAGAAAAVLPVALGFAAQATPAGPDRRPSPARAASASAGVRKLKYNRDIRPILVENCFACHGPDSASRKADLRLDRAGDATAPRNGRPAIVKGKAGASEVVKRIQGEGPLMPPEYTKKKLTPQQVAMLKAWVDQGAEYEQHWSYTAPVRPALPAVKNAAWVRNSIDRFILAKLERAGLQPAPEADRRTLARRLSLDLTGLPPDPADVDAFVADRSPAAYEKLVDKFMASPAWGEHRGRYWLDAARYADTHGIHFDNYREMWSYRDWVIQAFNRNMPFDEFTIEQLAGDLLPNPTLDQRVATGFNRCNITSNEGGLIPEEYLVLYTRDRTETASAVWLGSTLNCCVCHDHKFDPFTMKDFYSLSAFFNNTTQGAMDGNIKDTPPIIFVPIAEDRTRWESLQAEIAAARKQAEARKTAARADYARWLAKPDPSRAQAAIPAAGLQFRLPLDEGQGRAIGGVAAGGAVHVTAAADPGWTDGAVAEKAFFRKGPALVEIPQAGDFERDRPFTVAAWIKPAVANQGGAVVARMDDQHDYRGWDMWMEGGRIGTHIVSKWPADALKVVTREPLAPGKWHHVCIAYAGDSKASSVRIYVDGAQKEFDVQADALKSTIRTAVPLKLGQRHTTAQVEGMGIQDLRLYDRALPAEEAAGLATSSRAAFLASRPPGRLTKSETDELFNWWLPGQDAEYRATAQKLAGLDGEERAIRGRATVAHVMQEKGDDAMAFVLFRGDYDKRRDPVKPITPAVLPPMPPDLPRNRLGLAKWLLRPEHPLTARVTVNRFWQELFGNGIVKTSGDFGISGELPSHPELLDWLAVEFREGGWDIKRFYKLMVTSAAYRQSSVTTAEKRLRDPENRLLSRGPRFRMDAEMVRDYALAASGLLVRKIGGPSVKPYQPDGVWEAVAMIGSNTRDYKRDSGESLYRRSMYTFWKRAAPPASMDIFNAPNRETCCVRRERTDTPLQALTTMNDPQFVEAARVLAQRAAKAPGLPAAGIDVLARRLLARSLRPVEAAVAAKSLGTLQAFYAAHPKEAQELIAFGESRPDASINPERLAAWTMLANQLMNLDEVLNK